MQNAESKIEDKGKRSKITLFILTCIFFILFAVIAALTLTGVLGGFETAVYSFIAKTISPSMTSAVKVLTFTGDFLFLCILAVLLVLIPQTRRKIGFPAALSAIISALLNLILKNVFKRARPVGIALVQEAGLSFPSGHTQSSTAFFIAAAILLLLNAKRRGISVPLFVLCIIFPFIIGLTRVYLGVHYAGDVLAGWALGAGIAAGAIILWQFIGEKIRKYPKAHKFFFESPFEIAAPPAASRNDVQ